MALKPSKSDLLLGSRMTTSETRKMSTLVKHMGRVNAQMLKVQRAYTKASRKFDKAGMVEPPSVRKKSKEGFRRLRELVVAGKKLNNYKNTLKRKYKIAIPKPEF